MVAMMVIMAATTEEPKHLVPLRNFAQGILLPLPSLFSTTTFCSPSVLVRLARTFLLRRASSAASATRKFFRRFRFALDLEKFTAQGKRTADCDAECDGCRKKGN